VIRAKGIEALHRSGAANPQKNATRTSMLDDKPKNRIKTEPSALEVR